MIIVACVGLAVLALWGFVSQTISYSAALAGGGKSLQGSVTLQGQTAIVISPTAVPPATVNQPYAISYSIANVQSIVLTCNAAITIKTNSTTAPDETITLSPGVPYVWYTGCGLTNLFSHNGTNWYLNNAGATQAILEGVIVSN